MQLASILALLFCVTCVAETGSGAFSELQLAAVEELRIGSVDDPEFALTWIDRLEVGPAGTIYTIHPQEAAIRVHDSNGAFVRTIGREGEGPGEFSNPRQMGIRGDTLWVLDVGTYRFSYFTLGGELLGSNQIPVRMSEDYTASPPRPRGFFSDGSIRGASLLYPGLIANGDVKTNAVLRIDSATNIVDTIAAYSVENTIWQVSDQMFYRQPFSDTELVAVSNWLPLIVSVDRSVPERPQGATFGVSVVVFDGDTVYSREYSYAPIAVRQALVDSLVEAHAVVADKGAVRARDALYSPEYHPPVSELLVGRDGSLWLSGERVGGATIKWRIISSEGDPVGVVELPARFRPILVEGNRAWGSWEDELDVPYIVRYWVGLPNDAPEGSRLSG